MSRKETLKQRMKGAVPYVGFLILVLLAVVTGGESFTSMRNIRNILTQSSILMVISVGTTFVMAHGNMDFANGGTMGLTMVMALAVCKGIPAWAVFPVCLIVGTLIGYIIGLLVTKLKVVAFIVGMCVMRLSSAVLYSVTNEATYIVPASLTKLNNSWFYFLMCVAVVILGIMVFEHTKVGQYDKLIGVNRKAAWLSGINVDRYLVIAFTLSGLAAGIAAFMTSVRIGGLGSSTGNYEVDALIGLTIGGMPLTGGSKASMRAAVIGALSLTVLNNILVIWGVNADFVNVIKGLVFLALVLISSRQKTGVVAG